jgi:hypothetical protein
MIIEDMTNTLKTNYDVLVYMIKRQKYYTSLIVASNNNAGSFIENNKLYFFDFYNMENHQKYTLTAYEILYSIKGMYLYTPEQYNTSSLVKQNYQVFGGKYNEFKMNESVYKAYHKAYQEALYYGDVYTNIQNSIYYKNMGLEGCFIFTVPKHLFPGVPEGEIKKAYSNQQIFNIYHSLSQYIGL